MWFEPVQDFWCEEFGSQYVAGLHYTVRSKEMAKTVEQWVADGKVRLVEARRSGLSGKGE